MQNNQRTSVAFRYARYILILSAIFLISGLNIYASQLDIVGPAGSGTFGGTVISLPNGNIVVVDTTYDAPGPILDVGAVYLYNGKTGALISTITGSTASDTIGSSATGITVLANGNFVIRSPAWDNGAVVSSGAVTFCSGTTGCSGVVSAANSLVGSTLSDVVGGGGLAVLGNGNYIVRTPNWDAPGPVANVGAVTFCSGTTGCSGTISAANSLVGSTASDTISSGGVFPLPNNNFIVSSNTTWDNGAALNAGAITFCSGTTGCPIGAVSAANSLVGSLASDGVGTPVILPNSNFVIFASNWDNGASANVGAATFCSGTTGCVGAVSAANSVIGATASDGSLGTSVSVLGNGNYVYRMPGWDNGAATDAGATVFCNGTTGCTPGPVTTANSLYGSTTGDGNSVTVNPLTVNNNYVVTTSNWDNGATTNAGAATWCSGTTGCVGAISPANSLIGSSTGDSVGSSGVVFLTNGNYVLRSTAWANGAATLAGAVTWCNGTTGCAPGIVTTSNSLVGSTASDGVGQFGFALPNGNYVIRSTSWDNGAANNAGAATWGDGTGGTTVGPVSAANSLIGSTALDAIGTTVIALNNGNYVIGSPTWDNGAIVDAGAATLGNGAGGTVGPLSAANSLVGSTTSDMISFQSIFQVGTSNYVVRSTGWDNGATATAGAVTWCNGATGCTGPVTTSNSLIGATLSDAIGAVTVLTNGNYIVSSTLTDNGAATDAGSITWGDGNNGTFGTVTAANSLMGSTVNDTITSSSSAPLANGNFVARSSNFDNGAITQAGAISYIPGNAPLNGALTTENSVLGTVASGGSLLVFSLNPFYETFVVGRPGSNTVTILNPTYTASVNGIWSAASTWNYGSFTGMHDVYIPNGIRVNLDVIAMNNSLRVDCNGRLTGTGASAYIIGNFRKDFCTTGAFSYPVGTANGYSPVDTNITALGTNPSSLTISASQTAHPTLDPTNSLKRYWSLTEIGDLTTDLTFNYLDPTDISTLESTYKLYRVSGGMPLPVTPFTLDIGANTISTSGISDFSDWAVGNIVPLAADVSVGGRVLAANGAGIKNVIVSITDSNGISRTVRTGSFGYYNFDEVEAGGTYIVSVASKRFVFANPTQVVTVNDNIGDLDFISEPQLRSEGGKSNKEN